MGGATSPRTFSGNALADGGRQNHIDVHGHVRPMLLRRAERQEDRHVLLDPGLELGPAQFGHHHAIAHVALSVEMSLDWVSGNKAVESIIAATSSNVAGSPELRFGRSIWTLCSRQPNMHGPAW
jgi:hypothetical protein